ncbi:MAG: lipid-binding SYLF domain-containing protein [Pirellulales bacterium]
MLRRLLLSAVFVTLCCVASPAWANDPVTTIQESEQVLGELLAIPGKRISQALLADAQAVAVIPRVVKVGFIAGVRRGHGVVMVRDTDGDWSLPQFLTLTGGSVGWQAGIQGSDVVLVFKTKKSVEGLLKGKFTIGVDAAASAGPVGRNAAAATDAQLKAEILSYSRSRGLFVGASIDGSALEMDPTAHAAFYGAPNAAVPQRIPESAAKLRQYLVELTAGQPGVAQPAAATVAGQPVVGQPVPVIATPIQTPEAVSAMRLDAMRGALVRDVIELQKILTPEWRQYLALPREIVDPTLSPTPELVAAVAQRYGTVAKSQSYKELTMTPEFQATLELLEEYSQAMASVRPVLRLPPPPRE